MSRKVFKLALWKRYVIVRWKQGPFHLTGMMEIEIGLTRWL